MHAWAGFNASFARYTWRYTSPVRRTVCAPSATRERPPCYMWQVGCDCECIDRLVADTDTRSLLGAAGQWWLRGG